MDETLRMMLQRVLDGQERADARLTAIEQNLAEKRGERRVALWVAGATAGYLGSLAPSLVKMFGHR
jgi:hypothetical protein